MSISPSVPPPGPSESLQRLREGNARFVSGDGAARRSFHSGLSLPQTPFAVVLGCSDARAPAEYVFDQDLGDLFVIRVAGNIVAPSLVGSVEFATGKFGTRLVVVMGHTGCGAVAVTLAAVAAIVSVLVVCCSVLDWEQAASRAKAGNRESRERRIRRTGR